MKLVIIESPYKGDVERNKLYLRACIRDCINRGESPYASHRMLTDALDDTDPVERAIGIKAGLSWRNAHMPIRDGDGTVIGYTKVCHIFYVQVGKESRGTKPKPRHASDERFLRRCSRETDEP